MKGKDIVKIIEEHNLGEFDLRFVITNINEMGICVETYNIDGLCDIGHSSNSVSFDGDKV